MNNESERLWEEAVVGSDYRYCVGMYREELKKITKNFRNPAGYSNLKFLVCSF
jgi:hypothetical protein